MSDQGQLSISTERHDKGTVLCVNGRVDATNAGTLEGVVRDQLEAGQPVLAFDFTNLGYISSAGLRVLLVETVKVSGSSGSPEQGSLTLAAGGCRAASHFNPWGCYTA